MQDSSAEETCWCSSVDVYSLWADLSRKFLFIWIIYPKMKYSSSSGLAESSYKMGISGRTEVFFPTAWTL